MNILVMFLALLAAAALGEMIYGICKRSGFLACVGAVVLIMCALGLYLAICCVDSIYITGPGQLV